MLSIKHYIKKIPFINKLNLITWHWSIRRKTWLTEAKNFFEKNIDDVNFVANLLCDAESKNTYLQMIKFRTDGKKSNIFPYHGAENQYFINNFFNYGKDEVFIDCGAYDGDTIDDFLKIPGIQYKQIIAFEPNTKNFEALKNKYGENDKFVLINAGTWHKNGKLYFDGQEVDGKVSEVSSNKKDEFIINVCSIDSLHISEKVTFIKMDIEGAEFNALKGAEQTILKDKPKLAICIYHSNEDMIRIAKYIHELVPEYKLYVRQHLLFFHNETVIYAQI